MNVVVTGASGLIGSTLVPFLTTGGHRVTRLVRSQPSSHADEIRWDPQAGVQDVTRLEGQDAVVHLAGANIAEGRWTVERKAIIRESRVQGTSTLCETLARLSRPPNVLLCASAIGYYGDRGNELLTEESAPGSGFLADICRAWEGVTQPAAERGIRVVLVRIGLVLSPTGGALAKMLWPFKLGLGGVLGSGTQYLSWIVLEDLVRVLHHALVTEDLRGPVNAVTPQPVTNREFTKILGRVLKRPTFFSVPAFVLRLLLGEMADQLLLASARVEPKRLLATNYPFRYPDVEGALRHMVARA